MKKRNNPLLRRELEPHGVVEVQKKHFKLRAVLLVLCIAIAVAAFGYGVFGLLRTEPGWREISVQSDSAHCGSDFKFQYNLGASGQNPTAENKALTALYSQACASAQALFDIQSQAENGIAHINRHINEAVTVDERLYRALETVERSGSRLMYLAPVYGLYANVFTSANTAEAMEVDPKYNPQQMAYVQELMAFVSKPEQIALTLLGNNQVKLQVGQEYLAYAVENELEVLLDFGWLKNAFVADFLAQTLIDGGYTHGYLASFDGFTRNLDTSETEYAQNVFDRLDKEVSIPAVVKYQGAISMVFLRNYPLSANDRWHYYAYKDNDTITTCYLDPADGLSKSATDNLLCYSKHKTCGEIALKSAEIFLKDAFHEGALQDMTKDGIYALWAEGTELRYNETGLTVSLTDDASYTLRCVTE